MGNKRPRIPVASGPWLDGLIDWRYCPGLWKTRSHGLDTSVVECCFSLGFFGPLLGKKWSYSSTEWWRFSEYIVCRILSPGNVVSSSPGGANQPENCPSSQSVSVKSAAHDAVAVVGGVGVYVAFASWVHGPLTGVALMWRWQDRGFLAYVSCSTRTLPGI